MNSASSQPSRSHWLRLLDPANEPLIQAVSRLQPTRKPGDIASLRRQFPDEQDLIPVALDLVAARRKAASKFPSPDLILADSVGMEQATPLDIARHKAARFKQAGIKYVLDLCTGIGGDAAALGEIAKPTVIDIDPDRVLMARHNVATITGHTPAAAVADITTLTQTNTSFHLDPARRNTKRRLLRYEDYEPGPDYINRLLAANPTGAIKLSPAIDPAQLPPGEVEFISKKGSLSQAVLWTGDLAQNTRSATIIGSDAAFSPTVHTITGTQGSPPTAPIAAYLYAIDPAVERAQLQHVLCNQLDLVSIHHALGLLTSQRLVDSPFLTPFQLIKNIPYRPNKVQQFLRSSDAGHVEVKTRDAAVNPDQLQPKLSGSGSRRYTLFILRFDRQLRCLITQRIKDASFPTRPL